MLDKVRETRAPPPGPDHGALRDILGSQVRPHCAAPAREFPSRGYRFPGHPHAPYNPRSRLSNSTP